jgi:hypothetical protein
MTEADARAQFGEDAQKVPGSLEIRKGSQGSFRPIKE